MATRNASNAIRDTIAASLSKQQAAKMYGVEFPADTLDGLSQAAKAMSNSMNDLVEALKKIPIYNPVLTTSEGTYYTTGTSTTTNKLYTTSTGSSTSNGFIVGSSIGTGSVVLTINGDKSRVPEKFLRKAPLESLETIEIKSEKTTEIIKTAYPEIPMQYWFVGRIKNLLVNYFVDVTVFDCLAGIKEMYVTYKKTIYKIDDCDGLFYGLV